MSLATRCPACGTVFRLVRDQLKVSEGWVRCGRCTEVFNASQRLFDLEQEVAPIATAGPLPAAAPAEDASMVAAHTALSPAIARVSAAFAPPSKPAEPPAPARDGLAPPTPAEPGVQLETAAAPAAEPPVESTTPAHPSADAAELLPSTALPPQQPPLSTMQAPDSADTAAPTPTPEFILRADRAARWRHPARRGMLAAVALLLTALLAAQMALHYRDGLAAGWPASQPWLQGACQVLGCRIEAPRRIDSLSVDSSGLVRVEGSPLYRLSLVLQNSASTVVRMPAIDLALTDTQGQTMVRRVLSASDLGHSADSLPPRGEVLLQATLELGERRVAGYTVELFYP